MKNKYILKQLAESNHLFGTHLTKEQIRAIRKTRYSSLLRDDVEKSRFEKLLENALDYQQETPQDSFPKRKRFNFYTGVNKDQIANLTNELEDLYNMGLSNDSTSKYDMVDANDLKYHIKKYIVKNENKLNTPTKYELFNIIHNIVSPSDIMGHLYSICAYK